MFCTKCGNNLPENARFCTKCGNQIGNAPAQASPAAPVNEQVPAQDHPAQASPVNPTQVYPGNPQQNYASNPAQVYPGNPQQSYASNPTQGYPVNFQQDYGYGQIRAIGVKPATKKQLFVWVTVAGCLHILQLIFWFLDTINFFGSVSVSPHEYLTNTDSTFLSVIAIVIGAAAILYFIFILATRKFKSKMLLLPIFTSTGWAFISFIVQFMSISDFGFGFGIMTIFAYVVHGASMWVSIMTYVKSRQVADSVQLPPQFGVWGA